MKEHYKYLISICIAAYNTGNYIGKCLQSIVNYKSIDYEIVIVNDNSSDDTKKIIDKYKNDYANISFKTIHLEQHVGCGAARNIALHNAQGRYIWPVDSDDMLAPNALKYMLKQAKEANDDIIIGQLSYITEKGNTIFSCHLDKIYKNIIPTDYPELADKLLGPHCTMIIHQKLIKTFDFKYPEGTLRNIDGFFVYPCVLKSKSITLLPNIIYYYRQREGSICKTDATEQYLIDDIRSYKRLYEFSHTKKELLLADYRFISVLNSYSIEFFNKVYTLEYYLFLNEVKTFLISIKIFDRIFSYNEKFFRNMNISNISSIYLFVQQNMTFHKIFIFSSLKKTKMCVRDIIKLFIPPIFIILYNKIFKKKHTPSIRI